MPIHFEFAQTTDLPKIVSIYNQAIKQRNITADLTPITVADREPWLAQATAKYPIWSILDDNNVIGWISLESFYGRAAYHETAEVSIYLDTAARGHHIGTQALEFVISQLKQRAFKNVVAFIFKQNIPSIKLFEKLGFQEWGLLPQVAEIDDNYLDLAILGKHFEF